MLLPLALALAADLTPDSVPNLKVAWAFHTRAAAPDSRTAHLAAFEATPVLAEGLVYIITPFNQVIALDPATGRERWRFDPHISAGRNYSEVSARGVAVAGGVVYFGTLDARLMALRARDGKLLWQTELSAAPTEIQITSPPSVVNGTVIVGSAIGDNARAEMDRGTVRAFDAKTGRPKWAWDPTPAGTTGAANAWAPIAADVARDMVFVPTGSPSPDYYGGLRPGDGLYGNSVVALQASTGKVLWHFQVVHHDLWDYDVASQPVLIDFKGKPAIGVLTKVGHYFALDRLTGEPLIAVREQAVPRSLIEGEVASPTQPIPASGVFTAQKFVPRPGACQDEFQKLRYEGVFTPPSLEGSLVFPGNVGGANWGGGSYDAERGLLFVAANRLASSVHLISRAAYESAGHGDTGERLGLEYGAQKGTPYAMSRKLFVGPDGLPCNEQPWGGLAAIDVVTGKLRWEVPLSITLGGPLSVDGVVFFGAGVFEKAFAAYDAETGRQLWQTQLPFTAQSTPGTYRWKGKRYIVICAGGHGKVDGNELGDAVIAFVAK